MKTKYVRKFGAQRLETMCVQLLQPGAAYLYPLKTSENLGFLMFSGGIDKQHRAVMSQIVT